MSGGAAFKIEGLNTLRKELRSATNTGLEKEIRKAWRDIGKDIIDEARADHRFITRSGNLERSLVAKVAPNGTWMYIKAEKGIAPYAAAVHNGRKARTIYPKSKKALAFPTANGGGMVVVKSVRQDAVPADPFLANAFTSHIDKIKQRLVLAYRAAIK